MNFNEHSKQSVFNAQSISGFMSMYRMIVDYEFKFEILSLMGISSNIIIMKTFFLTMACISQTFPIDRSFVDVHGLTGNCFCSSNYVERYPLLETRDGSKHQRLPMQFCFSKKHLYISLWQHCESATIGN